MRVRGLWDVWGRGQSASGQGGDVGGPPLLARSRRERTGGLCPPVAKAADRVMESAWGRCDLGCRPASSFRPALGWGQTGAGAVSGRRFGFLTGLSPRSARLSRLAEVQARKEHGGPDHAGAYSNGRTALVLDALPYFARACCSSATISLNASR